MAIKQNIGEAAKRLAEGQLDPHSTVAREILQEIAERVLRGLTPRSR
jgi:hypothetical protein